MKKAILTIGLFSLVVLTTFTVETSANNSGGDGEPIRTGGVGTDLGGGQSGTGNDGRGGTKKLDFALVSQQ